MGYLRIASVCVDLFEMRFKGCDAGLDCSSGKKAMNSVGRKWAGKMVFRGIISEVWGFSRSGPSSVIVYYEASGPPGRAIPGALHNLFFNSEIPPHVPHPNYRGFPILNSFNLTRVYMYAITINQMPKEMYFLQLEFTLGEFCVLFLLLEQF
nr:hypothetical protein [Tanacetum cinerariifolium]